VLPDVGFLDRVLEWVAPIAGMPRPAVVAAKRALVDGNELPLAEGLALEGRLFIECQTAPDTLALQDDVAARYRDASDDEAIDL
jgi:enoyl-CoA hydratase/carnithine racemase